MKKIISSILCVFIVLNCTIVFAGDYQSVEYEFNNHKYYFGHTSYKVSWHGQEKYKGQDIDSIPSAYSKDGKHEFALSIDDANSAETILFPHNFNYSPSWDCKALFAEFDTAGSYSNIIIDEGIVGITLTMYDGYHSANIVLPESLTGIRIENFLSTEIKELFRDSTGRIVPFEELYIKDGTEINPIYKEAYEKFFEEQMEIAEKTALTQAMSDVTFYVKENSYAERFLSSKGYNTKRYISVIYNGSYIHSDQPATIVEGRTLLPLRACLEALGASVEWDDASKTVTSQKGNTKISLTIGSDQLYVNGSAKTLDVPAQIMSGRTMVPVRAIAEAYQCKVEWDGTTNSVHIQ